MNNFQKNILLALTVGITSVPSGLQWLRCPARPGYDSFTPAVPPDFPPPPDDDPATLKSIELSKQMIRGRYQKMDRLGRGAFASIFRFESTLFPLAPRGFKQEMLCADAQIFIEVVKKWQ